MSDLEDTHKQIDEAKAAAERLVALLDDPHPGLITWNTSYHSNLKKLMELSGYADEKK